MNNGDYSHIRFSKFLLEIFEKYFNPHSHWGYLYQKFSSYRFLLDVFKNKKFGSAKLDRKPLLIFGQCRKLKYKDQKRTKQMCFAVHMTLFNPFCLQIYSVYKSLDRIFLFFLSLYFSYLLPSIFFSFAKILLY